MRQGEAGRGREREEPQGAACGNTHQPNFLVTSPHTRIGELTAGSLQGISTAMETGMKQFNRDIKELREVMSAEITARRNGNDKLVRRVQDIESREEAGLNELGELMGTELRKVRGSDERSDELTTSALETKATRAHTSVKTRLLRNHRNHSHPSSYSFSRFTSLITAPGSNRHNSRNCKRRKGRRKGVRDERGRQGEVRADDGDQEHGLED